MFYVFTQEVKLIKDNMRNTFHIDSYISIDLH